MTSKEGNERDFDSGTSSRIFIGDLDRAAVLAALYNNARIPGAGIADARSWSPITVEEARNHLERQSLRCRGLVDYVQGRTIHCDLRGEWLDARSYDRDNGSGRGAAVISRLRETGSVEEILGSGNSGNRRDRRYFIDPGGVSDYVAPGEPAFGIRELLLDRLADLEEILRQAEAGHAELEELRQRMIRSALAAQENLQRLRQRLDELDAAIARAESGDVAPEQELISERAECALRVASMEERLELVGERVAQGYEAFERDGLRIEVLRRTRDRARDFLAQWPQEPGSAE